MHKSIYTATLIFLSPLPLSEVAASETPSAIEYLKRQGNEVIALGKANGLDGYLLIKGAHKQTVYVTPDGKAVIAGLMFNDLGENLTANQLRNLEPIKTENGLSKTPYGTGFRLGSGGELVIVYADPLCPACHKFLKDAVVPIKEGKLSLFIIPVGVIAKESTPIASSLIQSAKPAVAWVNYHNKNDHNFVNSQANSNSSIILENNAIFSREQFRLTPTILRKNGDRLDVMSGAPKNISVLYESFE